MDENFRYCEQRVREQDRDRFLAALFAPAVHRHYLYALYAFDLEISGLVRRLREPLAGELRLQWWREVLQGERAEEARGHPLVCALQSTMTQSALDASSLGVFLDARSLDLYAEPMASTVQFEAYARNTVGTILDCAARILGSAGEGELEAAVLPAARALARVDAINRYAGEGGRLSLPADLVQRHRASSSDALAGRVTPELRSAVAELRSDAAGQFEVARAALARLPATVRVAFLHLCAVPLVLRQLERRGDDPFGHPIVVAPWRRQWEIWRASRRWLR